MDAAFGVLVGELRRRGLFDDLLLVISADHGEAMGQPDFKFGHGTHVEQVLRVPMLIHFPGGQMGGLRISTPVQLLDLYPTLAEWLGLECPDDLQGRSLVPLLRGETLGDRSFIHETGRLTSTAVSEGDWRLVVSYPGAKSDCVLGARGRAWLAENYPELGGDYFVLKGLSVGLTGNPLARKALADAREALAGPYFELFHIPSDPHLLRDVARDQPEIVARLSTRLKEAQELSELWIVRGLCHSTMKGKVLIDCRAAIISANGPVEKEEAEKPQQQSTQPNSCAEYIIC